MPLMLFLGCDSASTEVSGVDIGGEDAGEQRGDSDDEPEVPEPVTVPLAEMDCSELNPVPSQGRLLTRLQYANTIVDLFQGLVDSPDLSNFPPENEVLRFRTNAEFHKATPLLAEAHMATAEAVAAAATADLEELLPCSEDDRDQRCAESFIEALATRAFRRPLFDTELSLFINLFEETAADTDFEQAIAVVIEVLLQSPQFLYRFDFGGEALRGAEGFELTDYEMASRLSYFLYNSMPDAELFDAAAAGELRTDEQVEAQARRMLESPKARGTVRDFYAQWLGIERFNSVVRQAPGFEESELADSWRYSLELFLDSTFWDEGKDFASLMTSDVVFMDGKLASIYGVEPPDGLEPGEFFRTEFEPKRRSGLLTQPALLSLLSHSDQSAPILRGVFVRDDILCQPTPAPPPNVDQTPPDPDPNATTRERFKVHTDDAACAGCHSLIDTLGLGFEEYDHLGRYRDNEYGIPVDASGSVVAVREDSIQGPFNGAVELAERLSESEQVKLCVATQWYRYGAGRVEQKVDLCSIAQAYENFGEADNMQDLLVGLVLSDAFRLRGTTPTEEAEQ